MKALLLMVIGFVAVFSALPAHSSPQTTCYKRCKLWSTCQGFPCYICIECLPGAGTGYDTCVLDVAVCGACHTGCTLSGSCNC